MPLNCLSSSIIRPIYNRGVQRVWATQRRLKPPRALRHAQQAGLSALTATVFLALPFLHPAAVPLLSMSQISNDRRVCASCTKRACLWQLSHHLEALDGWRPAQVCRDPRTAWEKLTANFTKINVLCFCWWTLPRGRFTISAGWNSPQVCRAEHTPIFVLWLFCFCRTLSHLTLSSWDHSVCIPCFNRNRFYVAFYRTHRRNTRFLLLSSSGTQFAIIHCKSTREIFELEGVYWLESSYSAIHKGP